MTRAKNDITQLKKSSGNKEKGSYVLLIGLPTEQTIVIGRLNTVQFSRGYYAYVGSAMRGFEARLNRHLRKDKKLHWHIDKLLQRAAITSIILCETEDRTECVIARAFSRQFDAVLGFGCSDCKCRSHLFFAVEEMKQEIMVILDSLGMTPRLA